MVLVQQIYYFYTVWREAIAELILLMHITWTQMCSWLAQSFFTNITLRQAVLVQVQYICEELPSPCCIAWPLPHTPLIFTCLANSPLDLAIKLKTLYEQNVSRITFETGLCISFYNFLDICFCLKVLFYLFVELCHQNLLWRISCKQCDWWGMSYITALRDPPLPHTPTHKLQQPTRKCKYWKLTRFKVVGRPKLLSSVEYLNRRYSNREKPVSTHWQFVLDIVSTQYYSSLLVSHLSKSTKITTNTETTMLSTQYLILMITRALSLYWSLRLPPHSGCCSSAESIVFLSFNLKFKAKTSAKKTIKRDLHNMDHKREAKKRNSQLSPIEQNCYNLGI